MRASLDHLKHQFKTAKNDLSLLEQRVVSYKSRDNSYESSRSSKRSWDIQFKKDDLFPSPPHTEIVSRDRLYRHINGLEKEKTDLADQVAILQLENKALQAKIRELQSHSQITQMIQSRRKRTASCNENTGPSKSCLKGSKSFRREVLKEVKFDENPKKTYYKDYLLNKSKQFVDEISETFYKYPK